MFCNRIRGIVNDLDTEYGRKMKFELLNAFEPKNKETINAHRLGTHGALARDPSGRVIWTAPGHKLARDTLMKGVSAVLGD